MRDRESQTTTLPRIHRGLSARGKQDAPHKPQLTEHSTHTHAATDFRERASDTTLPTTHPGLTARGNVPSHILELPERPARTAPVIGAASLRQLHFPRSTEASARVGAGCPSHTASPKPTTSRPQRRRVKPGASDSYDSQNPLRPQHFRGRPRSSVTVVSGDPLWSRPGSALSAKRKNAGFWVPLCGSGLAPQRWHTFTEGPQQVF